MNISLQSDSRIVVALDYPDPDLALDMARQLDPSRCRVKVGKELFTLSGPRILEALHALGFQVFLDLKFHDIPHTVAKAVRAAAHHGVWMVNVHASGGRRMMAAAREELEAVQGQRPLLIAVTVLTSMEAEDLREVGIDLPLPEHVLRLASLSQQCGLDGVVCSAQEAEMLKGHLGQDFTLVTPGIRPAAGEAADQRRIMTPTQALAAGSDYLVIGRPVTQALSPRDALVAIEQEVQSALAGLGR